jgi:hypothetical protein
VSGGLGVVAIVCSTSSQMSAAAARPQRTAKKHKARTTPFEAGDILHPVVVHCECAIGFLRDAIGNTALQS